MAEIAQDTMAQAELAALGIEWPPSEDELPYDTCARVFLV
jgi:hypothetical protein